MGQVEIKNIPLVNDTLSQEMRLENQKRGMVYYLMVKHAVKAGLDKETFARAAVHRIGADNAKGFMEFNFRDFVFNFMDSVLISQFRPELMEMTDDMAKVDFHYCPMLGGLMNMSKDTDEIGLLCDCAMETDRGLTEAIGLDFELGGTIATGHPTCELCFKRRKKDDE